MREVQNPGEGNELPKQTARDAAARCPPTQHHQPLSYNHPHAPTALINVLVTASRGVERTPHWPVGVSCPGRGPAPPGLPPTWQSAGRWEGPWLLQALRSDTELLLNGN